MNGKKKYVEYNNAMSSLLISFNSNFFEDAEYIAINPRTLVSILSINIILKFILSPLLFVSHETFVFYFYFIKESYIFCASAASLSHSLILSSFISYCLLPVLVFFFLCLSKEFNITLDNTNAKNISADIIYAV